MRQARCASEGRVLFPAGCVKSDPCLHVFVCVCVSGSAHCPAVQGEFLYNQLVTGTDFWYAHQLQAAQEGGDTAKHRLYGDLRCARVCSYGAAFGGFFLCFLREGSWKEGYKVPPSLEVTRFALSGCVA